MTRIVPQHPTHAARSLSRLVLAVVALLLTASAADAALTTSACLVSKRKAWITFRKCQGTAQVNQIKGKPADLAKCQTTFQSALTKIDDKATKAMIPCRYGNNGDRTVTDYDTGLQWEQKSGRVIIGVNGFVCLPGDAAHCVNDKYTWDGANLFVGASTNGTTLTSCFFGHCDWRLPTIVELQTILLEPFPCATNPCIDPILGPTVAELYFSATSATPALSAVGAFVWLVDFGSGDVFDGQKEDITIHVRAVRTGL